MSQPRLRCCFAFPRPENIPEGVKKSWKCHEKLIKNRYVFEIIWGLSEGSFQPPTPDRDDGPDRFDQAEGPRTLQESVRGSQHARSCKAQDEPVAAFFEG